MSTVLVVDDSATDRRLAGGLLKKHHVLDVIFADNGMAALAQVAERVPDLILTDLQMPQMNGLELVGTLRREFPQVPVVLMTGQGSEEIAVQALRAGAASYVPKRRLAQDLLETVKCVLAASREQRNHSDIMSCMVTNESCFVLENDLMLIASLARYLRQAVRSTRLCEETEYVRIGVALEEALMNAYYHGNLEVSSKLREGDHKAFYELAKQRSGLAPYKDRHVHVQVRLSPSETVFVIRDEGPGFDPCSLPDPSDPSNLERPCGRGVMLMRTFMDVVQYNAAGNEVTLIKGRNHDPVNDSSE